MNYRITQAAQQSLNHIESKRAEIARKVSLLSREIADREMERQSWLEADALYKAEATRIKADGLR